MDIEIFEHKDGFGYRVGNVYQECDPECDGFTPMTLDRAEEMALVIKARIE